jgi:hypothetical protein
MFSKAALSTRSNNSFTATTVCVEIIAVCFTVFGGIGLYGAFLRPVASIIAARTWVPTPCTIIASAVKEHRGSEGDRTYSLEITYSYLFKGKPHQSDLYDFFNGSSSSLGWRNAVVDSLPPGRVTTCYVNPREPSQAVINRDLHAEFSSVFLPLCMFLFGLPILGRAGWWYLVGRRKGQAFSVPFGQVLARNLAAARDASASSSDDEGPLALKPDMSRRTKILAALFATLFWNGILSVFVFHVDEIKAGMASDWGAVFVWAFLTPFMMIGLFFVGWLGMLVLGLFNPRPVLTLSRARVPLGGKARLAWSLDGRWDAVESLTIRLKGCEDGDVPKFGSSNGRVFHDELVLERRLPDEIAAGEVEFAIPANLMHSFASKHAAIVWKLAVVGRIPWWPRVRGDFPIRVTPHE